jgi:polyhydroxybutyrate depolymerase
MPSSPVAVMAFNGKLDQRVLYDGGQSSVAFDPRVDLSVAESIQFWVEANGCDSIPYRESHFDGNILIDDYYTGCLGNSAVILVTIVDGGHAWPGAKSRLVSDPPTQDISANEMMLEFFLAHPKQK